MGRTARDKRPYLKPVTKIELSEGDVKRRIIFVALFLAIAVVSITFAVIKLLNPPSGWTEIKVDKSAGINSGEDFVFYYNLGQDDRSVSSEKRAILNEYNVLMVNSYHLFDAFDEYIDMRNVYYINHHPNVEITVDPALYRAFEQIEKYGDRTLYLGPVNEYYNGIFFCEEEYQTADYDPYQNAEIEDYYKTIADFANDRDSVDIKLLGDGKIMLFVSEKYEAFMKENQNVNYIDFSWMKNAFIADLVADNLVEKGFNRGILSSYNGFVRSFSDKNIDNKTTISLVADNVIYPAAKYNYDGRKSMVTMRDFAITAKDSYEYRYLSDGSVRTVYLDAADGKNKQSLSSISAYSDKLSCVDLMMEMIPVYIADAFDETALSAACEKGMDFILSGKYEIYCTDPDAKFSDVYNKDGVKFDVFYKR